MWSPFRSFEKDSLFEIKADINEFSQLNIHTELYKYLFLCSKYNCLVGTFCLPLPLPLLFPPLLSLQTLPTQRTSHSAFLMVTVTSSPKSCQSPKSPPNHQVFDHTWSQTQLVMSTYHLLPPTSLFPFEGATPLAPVLKTRGPDQETLSTVIFEFGLVWLTCRWRNFLSGGKKPLIVLRSWFVLKTQVIWIYNL